jgi:hypothetical protein
MIRHNIVINLILCIFSIAPAKQIVIEEIEKMPNFPQPYEMRDWKKVAQDFDKLAFDQKVEGEYLPLMWFDTRKHDFNEPTFALPPYIGHYGQANNKWDNITCLGAVSSAALVGIDKSNQNGINWVAMCQNYFSKNNGLNLYLNNLPGQTGSSFWYELFPNILFYRIYYHYPDVGEMSSQFTIVADRWYEACVKLGGSENPYTIPNFNYTSFDFTTMQPIDNHIWKEADAAAAIAWIEYMAYVRISNTKYLTAAKWAMDYLQNNNENPYYECLMPHGSIIAARMNAECGSSYDIKKMITWCLDGKNWRKWGISQGKWGKYDCAGLCCATNEGYAFHMNTFNLIGNIVPIVRYDDSYARAIGKLTLNSANASRLFYSNAHDKSHQTDLVWSKKYDPTSCIAYEGLQKTEKVFDRAKKENNITGRIESGSLKDIHLSDGKYEVLASDTNNTLTHIWTIDLRSIEKQVLVIKTHCTAGQNFKFYYKINDGQWTSLFSLDSTDDKTLWTELPSVKGKLDIKIQAQNQTSGQVFVDELYVRGTGKLSPFATGDPRDCGWGNTNLCLYGSAFAGIFGGIIKTTNVEGVLQLDCLATDYFAPSAYPTYLYYNPYASSKKIKINLGSEPKNLYDAVSNQFIAKQVKGIHSFSLSADSAAVIVITPADGKLTHEENKTLMNNVIIDYKQ